MYVQHDACEGNDAYAFDPALRWRATNRQANAAAGVQACGSAAPGSRGTSLKHRLDRLRLVGPVKAEALRWQIAWIGLDVEADREAHGSGYATGVSGFHSVLRGGAHQVGSGARVAGDLHARRHDAPPVPRRVHSGQRRRGRRPGNVGMSEAALRSTCTAQSAPALVTSIDAGNHQRWAVSGAASLYDVSRTGFRVDLGPATSTEFPTVYQWRVNYLGYDGTWPLHCMVGEWGEWGRCSMLCNGGKQHRVRQVLQPPRDGGRRCPKLRQTRACNRQLCRVGCEVSDWGSWGPSCYDKLFDGSCDASVQSRRRKVVVPSMHGGAAALRCAQADLARRDSARAKVPHVSAADARPMARAAATRAHAWRVHGPYSVSLRVDTSHCKFSTIPQYAFALGGGAHDSWTRRPFRGTLSGLSTIVAPDKGGFTVVIDGRQAWEGDNRHKPLGGDRLLQYAQGKVVTQPGSKADHKAEAWSVSWLAALGKHTGMTARQQSGWQLHAADRSNRTLALDVDTSGSGFTGTDSSGDPLPAPRYFTSLSGVSGSVWRTHGAGVVFNPTHAGFRVYITSDTPITPALAEQQSWTVSWIAVRDQYSGTAAPQHEHAHERVAWVEKALLAARRSPLVALFGRAQTTRSAFETVPVYVAALAVEAPRDELDIGTFVLGSSSVAERRTELDVFVLGAMQENQAAAVAMSRHMSVQYVGIDVVDCKLSAWSAWTKCDVPCGGGKQSRTRRVLLQPRMGGARARHRQARLGCRRPTTAISRRARATSGRAWGAERARSAAQQLKAFRPRTVATAGSCSATRVCTWTLTRAYADSARARSTSRRSSALKRIGN